MRRLLLVLTAFLSLAAALAAPAEAAWLWPVRGEVITQYRNGSDPYAGGQHRGIDIAAAVGTPVVAAAGGEVRFAGTAGSSGLTVSVRTGDGYDTSYLHLSSIAVHAGAHVAGGERLGAVGTTGERSATAPHLHFGVREAGSRYAYVDPLSLLPPATAPPPPTAQPGARTGPRAAGAKPGARRREQRPRRGRPRARCRRQAGHRGQRPRRAGRPAPSRHQAGRPAPTRHSAGHPARAGTRPRAPRSARPGRRAATPAGRTGARSPPGPSPQGAPRPARAPRGAARPINAPGRWPLSAPTSLARRVRRP